MLTPLHRRDFLAQATVASAALAATAATASARAFTLDRLPKSPTDTRTLGKTGIQVSLMGMGTGSVGVGQASNQTRLGVKEFTRVVRHALDRGIRLFDVADQYGSHTYLREALKGVPRDQYVIQTKTHATDFANCRSHLERYRMELGVDYIDIVLLHCMQKKGWQAETTRGRWTTSARPSKKDSSAPTAPAATAWTRSAPRPRSRSSRSTWPGSIPKGILMDDKKPDEVASQLQEMHDSGKGVIGMKIFGEGRINTPERRDASLDFVLSLGTVDAFIIGYESIDQVDDAIDRVEKSIARLKG